MPAGRASAWAGVSTGRCRTERLAPALPPLGPPRAPSSAPRSWALWEAEASSSRRSPSSSDTARAVSASRGGNHTWWAQLERMARVSSRP